MRRRGIEGKVLACFGVLVMVVLGGCAGRLERFEFTRLEMGVRTRIVTYAPSRAQAEAGASAAYARIAELDACMSDYRQDSELMRLCAHEPREPVPISKDLMAVLTAARQASEASDGAFDITVGPVVALWRQARKTRELPSKEAINSALANVGWRNLTLDTQRGTATLLKPGMKLDLGAIAKGYAAERAVDVLWAKGQRRCLVALAGDIFVGDPPPGERGWKIDILSDPERPCGTALLSNEAVSTSGDTEQFVQVGGTRYSHDVDPRTGLGVTSGLQATVFARRGEVADALSTAVCVMGAVPGTTVCARQGVAVVIRQPTGPVVSDEETYHVRWVERP